ncbi:PREDICTED: protein STAY-GREEN, chloroplastic-like [Lupinus angustifolius]|uniref:protein STAY-GREEN, chloroplastic-like n=2 Tax=Lupinus angustifolius TaxID=3871 RepID=UPI00092F4F66|nr:PREDICTED: protein STAY-GREEN, chloroplastic-like [Lupinus angustifolius]
MSTLTTIPVLSYKLNKPWLSPQQVSLLPHRTKLQKKNQAIVPVARLFGPAIFEASKLKVLFLGVDDNKHPGNLPRTYTLTHSDITSKLTLAISQTINNSQLQGWYNKLQRDEVVAQWRKVKGKMYLHVHCHISGGHFLLDLFARLRYYIFCKELPMVLKAFVHGDGNLFNKYPELEEALVWVHFHSNIQEFNKVECWGSLKDASSPSSRESGSHVEGNSSSSSRQGPFPSSSYEDLEGLTMPQPCQEACDCCFPPMRLSSIPRSQQDPSHPNDQEVPNIMTH